MNSQVQLNVSVGVGAFFEAFEGLLRVVKDEELCEVHLELLEVFAEKIRRIVKQNHERCSWKPICQEGKLKNCK